MNNKRTVSELKNHDEAMSFIEEYGPDEIMNLDKEKRSEILKLANNISDTVAHVMVNNGHVFDDPEILKWADNDGKTVADICDEKHPKENGKYNNLLKQKKIEELEKEWEELKNNAPKMF